MNPSSEKQPGINLPPPVEGASVAPAERTVNGLEKGEVAKSAEIPIVAAQEAVSSLASPSAMPALSIASPSPITPYSAGADEDETRQDREAVIKAKAIIQGTRENPYEQTKQISNLKAETLLKKYQKAIGT